MTTDIAILPIAEELLTCFCASIATVPDPPQQCCFRVGQVVSAGISLNEDECCNGLAWIRVVSSFPSEINFPEQDTAPNGNCAPGWLTVIFELGVLRCAPTDGLTNLTTCEQWTTLFENVMHDDAAMREAYCCLDVGVGEKILGIWEPLPTEGRCAGGTRTITVSVPSCIPCA